MATSTSAAPPGGISGTATGGQRAARRSRRAPLLRASARSREAATSRPLGPASRRSSAYSSPRAPLRPRLRTRTRTVKGSPAVTRRGAWRAMARRRRRKGATASAAASALASSMKVPMPMVCSGLAVPRVMIRPVSRQKPTVVKRRRSQRIILRPASTPRPAAASIAQPGAGMRASTPSTSWRAVAPVNSAWGSSTRRCASTGTARPWMWSGSTQGEPSASASAWAVRISTTEARGLAPRRMPGAPRVAATSSTR